MNIGKTAPTTAITIPGDWASLVKGKLLPYYSDRTEDGAEVTDVHLEGFLLQLGLHRSLWNGSHYLFIPASSLLPAWFHCRFMVSNLKLTLSTDQQCYCSSLVSVLSPQTFLLHTPNGLHVTIWTNEWFALVFSLMSLQLISTYYCRPCIILGPGV